MKLNYSKKILIASIVTLAVIVVLDVVFTDLLLGKIFDINDKVRQLEISSQEREKELNLKDSIASSKVQREKLGGYFVDAGDIETLDFTKYLEDLAKDNGVIQSKTLNYEPAKGLESSNIVSSIRYKFTVSGSWSNVFNFIQAIENLPKVSSLNSVSLSSSLGDSSSKGTKVGVRVWSAELDFSVANLKN